MYVYRQNVDIYLCSPEQQMYFIFALFGLTLSENATFIDDFLFFVKQRLLKRPNAMDFNFCTFDLARKNTGIPELRYISTSRGAVLKATDFALYSRKTLVFYRRKRENLDDFGHISIKPKQFTIWKDKTKTRAKHDFRRRTVYITDSSDIY